MAPQWPLYRPSACAVLTTVPAGRPQVSRPNAVGADDASSARLEGPCHGQAAGVQGPCPVSHGLLLGGPTRQHRGLCQIWFKTPIFRVRRNSWSGRTMSPCRGPRPDGTPHWSCRGVGGGEVRAAVAHRPSLCGLTSTQSPQSRSGDGPHVLASSDSSERTDFPRHAAGRG